MKGLVEIVAGDQIDFLCDYYNYDGTFNDAYYLGERIAATGDWVIGNAPLGRRELADGLSSRTCTAAVLAADGAKRLSRFGFAISKQSKTRASVTEARFDTSLLSDLEVLPAEEPSPGQSAYRKLSVSPAESTAPISIS
ncbi:MAG: hypothetical protein R2912_08770 [Eubacteriales bacterium]